MNNSQTTKNLPFKENFYMMLAHSFVREVEEITSTHNEADFQLVFHA